MSTQPLGQAELGQAELGQAELLGEADFMGQAELPGQAAAECPEPRQAEGERPGEAWHFVP